MKAVYIALILVQVFGGCTQSALMRIKRENTETEQRISTKERQLENLESTNKILMEDKENLLLELENKKMTLDQLSARLDKLQRENDKINAVSDRQKKEKERLELQITKCQEEIDALKGNSQLSVEEKRKRIDNLKETIRAYLEMGLR